MPNMDYETKIKRLMITAAKRRTRTVLYTTARGASFLGKLASGSLYNSYLVDTKNLGNHKILFTMYAAEHIQYIIDGRPPHPGDDTKLIPIEGQRGSKFRQWADRKGRNPYAVRRIIQKFGIKPLALDAEIADEIKKSIRKVLTETAIEIITNKLTSELT